MAKKKIICDRDCFNCKFDDCIADIRVYSEKSLYKNRSPQAQANQRALAKKKRDEAKANGLCMVCRKRKATHGSKCYECYLRQKKYDKAKYHGRREFWREKGLCYFCGNNCIEGKKVCEKHYKFLFSNITKINLNPTLKMLRQKKEFNGWRKK